MKKTPPDRIVIYCDGACSGNQFTRNKGGWGAVLRYGDHVREISGGERDTTNQRMELTACISALEILKKRPLRVDVYSDSAYLVSCIRQGWYRKWQLNGWRNAAKKPVENRDLWERLIALLGSHEVAFHKVEGHHGVELNERADALARKGAGVREEKDR
jgi:ribonuclease HI